MNFRSCEDMCQTLTRNLYKVPRDVDLIVGIPRSGLLAANILALYLNLPFTDLEGFLAGRILSIGRTRRHHSQVRSIEDCKKILVIDDSLRTGTTIQMAKDKIGEFISYEILFSAVYVAPEAKNEVDIYFEICKLPRIFEWNLMHHKFLGSSCVEIDGVLCHAPQPDESSGAKYLEFLESAQPLFLPTICVGNLVTSRLEKYRKQTEAWLDKYHIQYTHLTMLNSSIHEDEITSNHRVDHKAKVYRQTKAALFIESDLEQSTKIYKKTNRPVICVENMELISSGDPIFSLPIKPSIKHSLIKYLLHFTY